MIELIAQHAPLIALLFFFLVFLGIVFWVLQPRRKNKLEALGKIPLREEKKHGRKQK